MKILSLIINLLGKKKENESKKFKTSLSINLSSFPNNYFILENVIFAYLSFFSMISMYFFYIL